MKCATKNPRVKKKCITCGKPRPVVKRARHLEALNFTYEDYIAFNGGEFCGICKCPPSEDRRLDRDHDHSTGKPRGLLCWKCNKGLWKRVTPEWLRAAADYLERAAKIHTS